VPAGGGLVSDGAAATGAAGAAGGGHGVLVGVVRDEIHITPLAEVAATRSTLDTRLLELARVLAQ
jgi:hypothetical protein